MSADAETLRRSALAFFGRVGADISHDFRNRLATIGEKNGLLADLVAMDARGRPLDPERVLRIARDVERQIEIAQELCSRLSGISHSAGEEAREHDLWEIVGETADLMERRARLAEREVVVAPNGGEKVVAIVDRFALEHALFSCIAWALESPDAGTIVLGVERGSSGPAIAISGARFGDLASRHPGTLDAAAIGPSARVELRGDDLFIELSGASRPDRYGRRT